MFVQELLAGIGTGLAGGFTSGLLGVSPGGGLVVFSVLLLGAEQHVAQGISLVAQISSDKPDRDKAVLGTGQPQPVALARRAGARFHCRRRHRSIRRRPCLKFGSAVDLCGLPRSARHHADLAARTKGPRASRAGSGFYFTTPALGCIARRRIIRRVVVGFPGHWRRARNCCWAQRDIARSSAPGADGQPCPRPRPDDNSICLGLLETGMVDAVADTGRRHHRTRCRN